MSAENRSGESARGHCPTCGTSGRAVKPITLQSLLKPDLRQTVSVGPYRFCANPACETVYFPEGEGESFGKSDLTVRVGLKETEPPRTVCYCFGHTVEEIEHDVAETGSSPVPDSIAEKCRAGLDRCEETNPKGSCCLGDVLRIIKEAQRNSEGSASAIGASAGDGDESSPDCNVAEPELDNPARHRASSAGRWTIAGTFLAAVLSSACCWLPLLLISLGISGVAVSSTLEQYRPLFIALTFAFLGAAFCITYRPNLRGLVDARNSKTDACCGEAPQDDACCSSKNGGKRLSVRNLNKIMLWIVTVFAMAFVFFPNYVGAVLGGAGSVSQNHDTHRVIFRIEGMSCEGCAVTVRKAIESVPDVREVVVNHGTGQAVVGIPKGTSIETDLISKVVEEAGYKATYVGPELDERKVSANSSERR